MAVSGVQFKMRYKIISRLKKAGATSKQDALPVEKIGFDLQERHWLNYFAGAFMGAIQKTPDHRYYVNGDESPTW